MSEWPDFDEVNASDYSLSALNTGWLNRGAGDAVPSYCLYRILTNLP